MTRSRVAAMLVTLCLSPAILAAALVCALALAIPAGAQTHGVTPQTMNGVTVSQGFSWQEPTSCSAAGASPCLYQAYILNGPCPSPVAGSTGWVKLGSPISALSFIDTSEPPGSTIAYVVRTIQGGETSGPSNCVPYTYSASGPDAPVLVATP